MGRADNKLRFNASYKLHTTKTDWTSIQQSLHDEWHHCEAILMNNSFDIQSKYTSVMATVKNCVRMHTPQPKLQRSINQDPFQAKATPWWNTECERAARLRKAAFQKFKLYTSVENFIHYRQSDVIAKKLFRETKRKYFLDFCGSLAERLI